MVGQPQTIKHLSKLYGLNFGDNVFLSRLRKKILNSKYVTIKLNLIFF